MLPSGIRYAAVAAMVLSLSAGCAGGSSTPLTPASGQSSSHIKHGTSSCPCLYVANYSSNSVTVYAAGTLGNVAPIQNISGGATGLQGPSGVAVDAMGNIYVSNDTGQSITVYSAGANGNAAPIQTISGSYTGLDDPSGIALNPVNSDVYVQNYENASGTGSITAYPQNANGNVTPSAVIQGPYTKLDTAWGVALDSGGNIYNANVDSSVTVYAAGSTGDVAPARVISGTRTKLGASLGLALDGSANIYVTNNSPSPGAVTVFATGANGNARPTRYLKGGMDVPNGIAVDGSGTIYVANQNSNEITFYAAGANRATAPTGKIKGRRTKLADPIGIAIH